MENTNKLNKFKNNRYVMTTLKGGLIATVVSLIGILFFAFIIKLFGVADGFLKPINQVIKAISIFIGVFLGLKKNKEKGLLMGLLIGIFYTMLAFVVFSALNGSFNFDKTILNDVLFGGITGAICGVICVNVGKKKWKRLSKNLKIKK